MCPMYGWLASLIFMLSGCSVTMWTMDNLNAARNADSPCFLGPVIRTAVAKVREKFHPLVRLFVRSLTQRRALVLLNCAVCFIFLVFCYRWSVGVKAKTLSYRGGCRRGSPLLVVLPQKETPPRPRTFALPVHNRAQVSRHLLRRTLGRKSKPQHMNAGRLLPPPSPCDYQRRQGLGESSQGSGRLRPVRR